MSCWVEEELAHIDLGDRRLEKRVSRVLQQMWQSPQSSVAAACGGWNETMAAYRLFDNEAVTVSPIMAAHQGCVAARAKLARLVLHIQDTTELDYSDKKALQGTGPLSELQRQGFFAHNEYVVQEDGVPLGVWHTHIYARDPQEHGEAELRKKLPIEQKESYRWLEAYRRACAIKQLSPGLRVVSLSDREGDIYELFVEYQQRRLLGQPAADWVIRSNQDRRLVPSQQADNAALLKIHSAVAQAPVLGTQTVRFRAKKQFKKIKGSRHVSFRTAREATLELRACQVQLKPPFRLGKKLGPITLWVLMAREICPPAGQDAIEWILLTNFRIETLKKARQVLRLYCLRWQIEVFHKILKSGCCVEKAQLKTAERLLPRVALQMIVAWRIHYVTMVGRACPELPCGVVFETCEWKPVVVVLRGKGAEKSEPTLGQMIQYIGQLGGHLNRKSDHDPGPQTIWRGMHRMHDFAVLWRALR